MNRIRTYLKIALAILIPLSFIRVDVQYNKNRPEWILWGNSENIHWDEAQHVWVNKNPASELWRLGKPGLTKPERVPVKKTVQIVFHHDACRKPEYFMASTLALGMVQAERQKRRFVLINVEQNQNYDEQYRVWPHQGLLAVGTAVEEEGWEVVLWDELVQSHATLGELIKPGDIVGLSLVASGIDRGVEIAKTAKTLDASFVIAGNDAAIFRANQLLKLPKHPIDAVFTSNSTNVIRRFFRELTDGNALPANIPEIATVAGTATRHTNESAVLLTELRQRRRDRKNGILDPLDGFVVPRLGLFSDEYWERVRTAYRSQYGHKHTNPAAVQNAIIHLAQGCTRTQGKDACTYCTIYGVGDVRIPEERYLETLVERYATFGVNTFFNVTDSTYEMRPLIQRLRYVGFRPETLILYGQAQGMARQPELLDEWMGIASERLLVNCGMDSGDERMLHAGVLKSSVTSGSRVDENRLAVRNLLTSGAHLHCSFIFGSPGETHDSCERTLEFVQWTADTLGTQLDVVEPDIYWLNYGSAAGRVFHDFGYAQELASIAGKTISADTWQRDFARHADALSVPWSAQEAWYQHFTSLDLEVAHDYCNRVREIIAKQPGHVKGRELAFAPFSPSVRKT